MKAFLCLLIANLERKWHTELANNQVVAVAAPSVAKFSFLPTMSLSALKSPSAERCINKQNAGQGFQPIGKPSHTPLNVVPI